MKRQALHLILKTLLAVGVLPGLLAGCGESAPVPNEAAPPQTPAERGRAVVTAAGCNACHSFDGTRGIGPSWLGSYGSQRAFKDGSTASVDEDYLRRAMLAPGAEIVEGYESIMLPAAVSEAQIADIIAFIRELGPASKQ